MKRKCSHLHFHGLNIQWISRWCRLTVFFFLLWQHANGNCLLTDIFSRSKISPFHWFWMALLNSTYPYFPSFCLPYSRPCTLNIAAVLVPLFSNAPSCSDCTCPRLFFFCKPEGGTPGDEKNNTKVSRTFQWCHKFMKMLFRELFWPQHDGKIPWGYLVMDCTMRPQIHATSVTTREGKQDGGARTLILIRGASFPPLFCSRPEVWVLKAWDLQWSSAVCF